MNQYTSKELSKDIAEAGFSGESDYYWLAWGDDKYKLFPKVGLVEKDHRNWGAINKNSFVVVSSKFPVYIEIKDGDSFPCYDILNDLCVKYPKEVWGEVKAKDIHKYGVFHPTIHTLLLLQENKHAEAEAYIRAYSILFKNLTT
jgi:hypothetical protein